MSLLRIFPLILSVIGLAGQVSVLAEGERSAAPEALVFTQGAETAYYRAVFAQFLAVVPSEDARTNVDCALSISNVCAPAAPEAVLPYLGGGGGAPDRGPVTLFLYNLDGQLVRYKTGPQSPGEGLNPDGTLGPGQTWTVRLAEVLAQAQGKPESEVFFRGYSWILAGFDCLVGTYSNTIFGLGFTQSYEMVPAMGQGGFFGGAPVF